MEYASQLIELRPSLSHFLMCRLLRIDISRKLQNIEKDK
jgi:hypothetical protein